MNFWCFVDTSDVVWVVVFVFRISSHFSRALQPELELGAEAPEPGLFRGAGALCEIQVELEPVVWKLAPAPIHFLRCYCYWRISHNLTATLHKIEKLMPLWCHCCDRKSRAACAQSFALWQQATIEFTCHDDSPRTLVVTFNRSQVNIGRASTPRSLFAYAIVTFNRWHR